MAKREIVKRLDAIEKKLERIQPEILPELIPVSKFLELGYMSRSQFYQKAPHGEIPGALKIGSKWFVRIREFLQSLEGQRA